MPVTVAEAGVGRSADREGRDALEGEVCLRAGVPEVVGDLASLEQDVQWHHCSAGLEDAEVHDREVGEVRVTQRDLVAGRDAARGEKVRNLVRGAVDLCVGEPSFAQDDRGSVG
jgi:hypothetical protein